MSPTRQWLYIAYSLSTEIVITIECRHKGLRIPGLAPRCFGTVRDLALPFGSVTVKVLPPGVRTGTVTAN